MGMVADDMNNGLMCQVCGVWMDDVSAFLLSECKKGKDLFEDPPGHPRTCNECKAEEQANG